MLAVKEISCIAHDDLMLTILASFSAVPACTESGGRFSHVVKFPLIDCLQGSDPFFDAG